MNNVEIVEWWHYKVVGSIWNFTYNLWLIKLVKIKVWFFFKKEIEWIVFSNFEDLIYEQIMSLKKFKEIVLYKVK